jgi:hypothetical protein
MVVVADDFNIVNTMGIRFVQKAQEDTAYSRNPLEMFSLIIHYKGTHVHFKYPTRELRDAQFEAIRAAMVKK